MEAGDRQMKRDPSYHILAVKITDKEAFSVSVSVVYRLLKKEGLVEPRPINDLQ